MQTATSTDFRNHAAQYLTAVEQGEVVLILRHGKPIARLTPVIGDIKKPSWQEPALLLDIDGVSLSQELLKDREQQN